MDDFLYQRVLADGRLITVVPLTYSRARITIGPVSCGWYDDGW